MTSEDREELRGRIRHGEHPSADATVVLRGGPDTPSLLATHAKRLFRAYVLDGGPVYGVSVFLVLDDIDPASEVGLLGGKLRSDPFVYRTTAGGLVEAGFELLATFARPHYTVVLPSLDAVNSLANALGTLTPNPYAGHREEER